MFFRRISCTNNQDRHESELAAKNSCSANTAQRNPEFAEGLSSPRPSVTRLVIQPQSGWGMLMLWLFSLAISQALQVCLDGGFQLGGFGELRVQLGDESLHLLRERLGVVLTSSAPT